MSTPVCWLMPAKAELVWEIVVFFDHAVVGIECLEANPPLVRLGQRDTSRLDRVVVGAITIDNMVVRGR